MAKKEILFEGLIDGALSQIYSTQANDEKKWFFARRLVKICSCNSFQIGV